MADDSAADVPAAVPVAAVAVPKRATVRDWSTAKLTRTLRMANLCNVRRRRPPCRRRAAAAPPAAPPPRGRA